MIIDFGESKLITKDVQNKINVFSSGKFGWKTKIYRSNSIEIPLLNFITR